LSGLGGERAVALLGFVGMAAVLVTRALATAWLWGGGHEAVSLDEFIRIDNANVWAHRPFLVLPFLWPPFPSYVYGGALLVHPDTLWTPRFVSLALGLVNLSLLASLVRRATRSRLIAVLTALLLALGPRSLRLGGTALAESLHLVCLLGGLRALLWWSDRCQGVSRPPSGQHLPDALGRAFPGQQAVLLTSGLLIAGAVATRYESWPLAALAALVLLLAPAPSGQRRWRVATALLPLLVMGLLSWHNLRVASDALRPLTAFASHSRSFYGTLTLAQRLRMLGWPLLDEAFPVLPLVMVAVWIGLRRRVGPPRLLLAAAAGYGALHLTIVGLGYLPVQFPERLAVTPLFFLAPLAAFAFAEIVRTTGYRLLLGTLLILPLGARGVLAATEIPTPYGDMIAAGHLLRELRSQRLIADSELVLVESRGLEDLVLFGVSSMHRQIVLDRAPDGSGPSRLLHPRPDRLRQGLAAGRVRFVLLRTPSLLERAKAVLPVEWVQPLDGYELLRLRS
jgi:hypothetical protein